MVSASRGQRLLYPLNTKSFSRILCFPIGCVDLTFSDNAGLLLPIVALQDIVSAYADQGLTRTDIWMLSAVVASEVTASAFTFPFQWIGRKTCAELNNNNCGLNSQGDFSRCDEIGGPHRELCHGDTAGTETIRQFMASEFGYTDQQTAAIMGAHTVGALRDVNLGFEGRSGWDLTNAILDQGYFIELAGSDGDPVQNAPDMIQVLHSNADLDGIPDRWQYEFTVNGVNLVMLNSDVAMVRNLIEGVNMDEDGRVSCSFKGDNQCDSDTPFMPFIEIYRNDVQTWLSDYRDALDIMIDNGYRRPGACGANEVCILQSI